MAINVKDYIKVKNLKDGLENVVPARNRKNYEQANDIEKKTLYDISEPTEQEVVTYYPNLAVAMTPVKDEKDAEIERLKKELAKANAGGAKESKKANAGGAKDTEGAQPTGEGNDPSTTQNS